MSSKYRNILTKYKDFIYDSKAEAQYSMFLDSEVKKKKIVKYERQVKFPITIKGVKICDYVADFVITYPAQGKVRPEILDVKGYQTAVFKLKWKMMQASYADEYKLVLVEV